MCGDTDYASGEIVKSCVRLEILCTCNCVESGQFSMCREKESELCVCEEKVRLYVWTNRQTVVYVCQVCVCVKRNKDAFCIDKEEKWERREF